MSEQQNEQSGNAGDLGYTVRTDVGGGTGTEGAVQPSGHPSVDPIPAADAGGNSSAADGAADNNSKAEAGKPLGDKAPALDKLQNQTCPNCSTGILYVTRYDPEASHETAQGAALAAGHESGGAYEVVCLSCSYSDSRAFNPGKQWGR